MKDALYPRVCVFHPGTQHSFRLALELKKRDLLSKFATSIFLSGSMAGKIEKFGAVGHRINQKLNRRQCLELDNFVVQMPFPELMHLFFSRIGISNKHAWLRWRNRVFGRWVSGHVVKNADIVWGFDTSSLEVFQKAKQTGIKCILDMSIAHPLEGERVLRIHAEKKPAYASDLGEVEKSKEEIERRNKEIDLADIIVTASSYTMKTIESTGVPSDKIVINPYGVDLSMFRSDGKNRKLSPVIFLFAGWFSQRKGIYYLLEAWEKAALPCGFELWLAGGSKDNLQKWGKKLPDNIKILGRLSHVQLAETYNKSHVFVFPSLFEGFGLVILEAMASGLPVITTCNTAGPDLIDPGVNGFLINDGDVDELTKYIQKLANDNSLRAKMGAAARLRAEKYTWSAYGDRCATICHNLYQGNKPVL